MNYKLRLGQVALASLMVVAGSVAMADPTPIFGADLNANFTVDPTAQPALQQRAFGAMLMPDSVKTESFQDLPAVDLGTTSPLGTPLSLLGGAAQLSMSTAGGHVEDREQQQGSFSGRFSTSPNCAPDDGSGCNWWESSATFSLTFAQAVSAFAFFGTDFGDFGGTLELDLYSQNALLQTLTVPDASTVLTGQQGQTDPLAAPNGNLIFYGFTDADQSYDRIDFRITQGGTQTDVLGFDDFMIGALNQTTNPIPEPGSLALVALSLVGLGVTRRKTRR